MCTGKDAPEKRNHHLCKVSLTQLFFIVFTYKMTTKQLYIKNRTCYFYNDLINVLKFEASNLKIGKNMENLDIYYIGYVDKKPDWNVNSVNPLYLIINRVLTIDKDH